MESGPEGRRRSQKRKGVKRRVGRKNWVRERGGTGPGLRLAMA